RLELLQGEAVFEVAKDPSRPFIVSAGSAAVTAVGTEFNVRRSLDGVIVSVLEGRVTVQPLRALISVPWLEEIVPTIQLGQSSAVTAGHRATVDHHGLQAVATLSDRSAVTDWERGRLAFDDESLRNEVEVVNRYSRKPIVIADADIE